MKTFQVTFNGYDASTSDTDHLISWINSPSIDIVRDFLDDTFPSQYKEIEEISYKEGKDDGVDLVLDEE